MGAIVTTEPTEEPVTVSEAKVQLRVQHSRDDTQISSLITAARRIYERETNRSLVDRTYRLDLYNFPRQIRLPYGPVSDVNSVTYVDDVAAPQTVSADDYITDFTSDVATITPHQGVCWPCIRSQPGAVSVEYVAGYGAAADVPQEDKQALLLIVSDLYDNRGTEAPMSRALKSLLESRKIDMLG